MVLEGKVPECRGCSMTKGFRNGIRKYTHARADMKLGRAVVDLSRPKVVEVSGGSGILSSCVTTFQSIRGYILCATSLDAAETFRQFLADSVADGLFQVHNCSIRWGW